MNNAHGSGRWEIVDENGIHFIFGNDGNHSACELTTDMYSVETIYTTAWKLLSVVSPEGNELATFSYVNKGYSSPNYTKAIYRVRNDALYAFKFSETYLEGRFGERQFHNYYEFMGYDLTGIAIPGVGTIQVDAVPPSEENGCHLISSMSFLTQGGNIRDDYHFSYTGNNRKYLSAITRGDSTGESEEFRRFTYYGGLPDQYHSCSQDIWGYYNAQDNTSLFATTLGTISNDGFNTADRYPNEHAKAGSLESITYPTGGKTCFEYENNFAYTTDSSYNVQYANGHFEACSFGESSSETFTVGESGVMTSTIRYAINSIGFWKMKVKLLDISTGDSTVYENIQLFYLTSPGPQPLFYNEIGDPVFEYEWTAYLNKGHRYRWVVTYLKEDFHATSSLLYPTTISYRYLKNISTLNTHEAICGGIRIKDITNYSRDNRFVERRTFSYLNGEGHSSGIAAPLPVFKRSYLESVTIDGVLEPDFIGIDEYNEDNLLRYSGCLAQYSDVTETVTSEADTFRTVYHYRARPYQGPLQCTIVQTGPTYFPFTPNDYLENLLLSKTVFKRENGSDVKIQKENYGYVIDEPSGSERFFRALGAKPMGDTRPRRFEDAEWFQASTYDIVSAKVLPASSTITEYIGPDTIVTVNETIYGNDHYVNPTQTRCYVAANASDVNVTDYQYSYDFPTDSVALAMVNQNVISQPLRTEQSLRSCTSVTQITDSVFTINGTNTIQPSRLVITRNGESQSIAFQKYDRYGNLLHGCLNDYDHRYYLWSYKGRHPIAEIMMGATAESDILNGVGTVFGCSSPDELSNQARPDTLKLSEGYLQSALPDALVSSFTYHDGGGASSISGPSGRASRFTYDRFSRLTGKYVPWQDADGNLSLKPAALYSYHYSDNTDPSSYVRIQTMLTSTGANLEENHFYDGLGRPFESSLKNAAPSADRDIVTLTEYLGLGREQRKWLPIAVANGGSQLPEATFKGMAQGSPLYAGDQYPYSENEFEPSALNRMTRQTGAGSAWHNSGKSVHTEWLTNTSANLLSCRRFIVDASSSSLSCTGSYPKGSLHVVKTTDEDGHINYVFTDFTGNEVLHRSILDGTTSCDTYFVYDGYGQLRCVLPPMASAALSGSGPWDTATDATLLDYAYLYNYDGRGRCTEKKLPGAEKVLCRYDALNHLVFSQDGIQRERGEWTFHLNDSFGRPVVDGTCLSPVPDVSSQAVTADYSPDSSCGYTIPSALSGIKLHSVRYYDDYQFLQLESTATALLLNSQTLPGYDHPCPQVRGQLTGQRDYVMLSSSADYVVKAFYYDERNRLVQVHGTNHLGGTDVEHLQLSFTGNPMKRKHVHTASNQNTITEEYTYAYDHADRLLTTTHSLNGGTPVVLAACEYDELGRLKSTKPLNSDALKTQYTYNVRSWPKTISSPLFTETLSYEDGTTPCWNGNISSMTWNADTVLRSYDYQYDGLSRLTQADYQETDGLNAGRFSTSYGYDLHGNMTNIIRKGWNGSLSVLLQPYPKVEQILTEKRYGMLDSLSLSYTGNQLLSVRNHMGLPANVSHRRYNFVDGANKTVEYTYDANGNLSKDLNKGISSIAYNALNLPDSILFLSGVKTNYRYGADGTKLQVKYTTPALSTVGPVPILSAGGTAGVQGGQVPGGGIVGPIQLEDEITTFDYCGNLIYENGTLTTLLFDGGYVSFVKSGTGTNATYTPTYHFYMRDHLGSNRVVASVTGVAEQVNHYYPYGSTFYGEMSTDHRFKYCGKELDKMHGLDWYDSSARYYDHVLGRFHQIDPLAEKYYSWSPYAYCHGNPVMLVDPDGNSPLSALIKATAKQGVKAGIKSYVKNNIERRLKNYMSKDMLKQFAKDADEVMGTLDNSWWENALELVPVAGDIYGSTKFVKQVTKAYDKLQDLENKYVGEIYKCLPKGQRDKFVKNMRSRGVTDARKDQAKGLDVGGDVKYEKGGKTDGHHTEKVSENPDKMTDPRTIEFKKQEDHIKYHQQNGY